jgi:hypothetical protein
MTDGVNNFVASKYNSICIPKKREKNTKPGVIVFQ